MSFERLDGEIRWRGRLLRAGVERFRHADGEVVTREKVWHPGAVGVLALDEEHVWLTRQPREAVGAASSLEIPAGKLDVAGESPLQTAIRELAEEIGKQAASWRELLSFYTSPGFSDERVWLFCAEGLSDAPHAAEAEENERIEVLPWPRTRVWEAVAACQDAKSLVALLWLAARSRSGSA
jgi:8-oxo-dGTP pyrophosphatase MutT (NUDIX family)